MNREKLYRNKICHDRKKLRDQFMLGEELMFGIEEARLELFDYISNLADNRAAIKPSQDEWSILDILEHLYVIEKVMTKEIKQILEKNDRKKAFKHKPLDGMLDRSNKFKAPENMKPNNEFTTLKEAKDKLTTSRHTLLNVLKAYDQSDLTANSGKHPAFGTISVAQWIEFIGLHEKRHLSQLKELVNSL
jgi:uncharacterized damage-inducible protein DinB